MADPRSQAGPLNTGFFDGMKDAARRHDEFMAAVYESDGDWTVVGFDDNDETLRVLVKYSPLAGTTTHALKGCESFPLACSRPQADELAQKVAIMDEHYWPPVNPLLGRIEDGRVVALAAPSNMNDAGRDFVRKVADEHGLGCEP